MRNLFMGMALAVLSVADARAQVLPSRDASLMHRHPYLDRLDYYMPRGALIGAGLGLVRGLAVTPGPLNEKSGDVGFSAIVGAGLGMMAGALLNAPLHQPPPPRPSPRQRYEPYFIYRMHEMSRYMADAGMLGAGTGLIYALMDHTEPSLVRGFYPMLGFSGGMVVGLVMFFLQHH